jgi:hypothetical protein
MESHEKQLGAHGGGIPPGWDFPAARQAAEDGLDLWLLDSTMQRTPWERMQDGASAARFAVMLREAGHAYTT